MNSQVLYKKALFKWGNSKQITMAIEECAELIKALAKHDRCKNGSTVEDIIEEMVDVEIMLGQLKIIFDYLVSGWGISQFDAIMEKKLKHLEKLLDE